MPVMYNNQNVDEKYSSILEPNLYYGSIFVPGVTCTDKYQTGPAGGIYVHKLKTTACEVGKPGRDFSDEETQDELIQILLNNNFQKSKKIYGVQAAAVGIDLANENLSIAIKETNEGRQQTALACLVQESSVSSNTSALSLDNIKKEIIAARTEFVKKKGTADIVMCSPETYGLILEGAGKEFAPTTNDRVYATGNVGNWLGFTFVEAVGLSATNAKYYDSTGTLKTVSFAGVDFIMYNHAALSIISNFETVRLRDSENFVGTKAQVELNVGYKLTNSALGLVRKTAA